MADAGELSRTEAGVGVRVAIDDPAVVFGDAGRLAELKALADAHLVVHATLGPGLTREHLGALARTLGPGLDFPLRPGVTDPLGFIAEFASEGRPDDGRPREPTWIESSHFDGDSAYSVQANLAGTPGAAMRFTDMAAVLADLPPRLRKVVDGGVALHGLLPPTTQPMSEARPLDRDRARRLPLVVRHPVSGVAVLRPPTSPHSLIEGLDDEAGRAALAELWAAADASPHAYEAVIGPGEMVIWEGVRAAHTNPAFPRTSGRRTWFYTVPAPWTGLAAFAG